MNWDQIRYQARNLRSLWGSAKVGAGIIVAKPLGLGVFHGSLYGIVCRRVGDSQWNGGCLENLGLLGMRVVTDAGVAALADLWTAGTPAFTNMKYHDSGTDNTAEDQTDTDLVAAAGPTTRATGTLTQPSANVVQSIGTIAYTGTLAIVEHGLFDNATRGSENAMWDRTVFAAINVVNGDSIQFTYQCTLTAGS